MSERLTPIEHLKAEGFDPEHGGEELELPDQTLKRLDYHLREGITPEVERTRQDKQLPTVDQVLEEMNRKVNQAELAERVNQLGGREVSQPAIELLADIKEQYHQAVGEIPHQPASAERERFFRRSSISAATSGNQLRPLSRAS